MGYSDRCSSGTGVILSSVHEANLEYLFTIDDRAKSRWAKVE